MMKWWRSDLPGPWLGDTEIRDKLLVVWLRHYVRCDSYDRSLAGFWFHGEWVPHDRAASLEFARQSASQTHDDVRQFENAPAELSATMRKFAAGLTYVEQENLLAVLEKRKERESCVESSGSD